VTEIHFYEEHARFEDVDAQAVVYHPKFLTYLERARCQFLSDKGTSLKKILEAGFGIVVASVEMKFVRPLFLEDNFFVATEVDQRAKSIVHMTQVIALKKEHLLGRHLREDLRHIETLRFFAHLKLSVINLETKKLTTPPPWLGEIFS
jgi:YbgC/YbaW family acyl-CoA thioester hydrolase